MHRWRAFVLAATLSFALHPTAYADKDDDDAESARRLRAEGAILPLEQIIESAQRMHPGRVIDTEFERKHGRYIYEIEILGKDGAVWELKFDAASGELIKKKQED